MSNKNNCVSVVNLGRMYVKANISPVDCLMSVQTVDSSNHEKIPIFSFCFDEKPQLKAASMSMNHNQ